MTRRVIVESPFAGDVGRNLSYGRAALRDCFLRGEVPFASHLLYTQPGVLDDNDPEERKQWMEAGFCWRELCDATVVYKDLGVSDGMREGIRRAQQMGHPLEFRTVAGWTTPEGAISPPDCIGRKVEPY